MDQQTPVSEQYLTPMEGEGVQAATTQPSTVVAPQNLPVPEPASVPPSIGVVMPIIAEQSAVPPIAPSAVPSFAHVVTPTMPMAAIPPANSGDQKPRQRLVYAALIAVVVLFIGVGGLFAMMQGNNAKQAHDLKESQAKIAKLAADQKKLLESAKFQKIAVRNFSAEQLAAQNATLETLRVTGKTTLNQLFAEAINTGALTTGSLTTDSINGQTLTGGNISGTSTTTETLVVRGATTVGGSSVFNGGAVFNGTNNFTAGITAGGSSSFADLIASGQVKLTGNANDLLLIQPSQNNGQTVFNIVQANGGSAASIDSNGNLIVAGDVSIGGVLNVASLNLDNTTIGSTTIGTATIGTLITTGNSSTGGNSSVAGSQTVGGNQTINGNLAVSGSTTLSGAVNAIAGITTNGLNTSGQLAITAMPSGTGVNQASVYINPASVSDPTSALLAAAVGGVEKFRVDASGKITADTLVVNTLTVTQPTTLTNTTISGTLDVTGDTHLQGNFTVDGPTSLASTIAVGGAASFGDTINVTGAATFGSTVGIAGDFAINNTFTVQAATGDTVIAGALQAGASTLASVTAAGDVSVGGNLSVVGLTSLSGLTAGATTLGVTTIDTLTVTNTATFDTVIAGVSTFGATTADSLAITNDASVGGNLAVTGNISGTNLNLTTDATIGNNLNVGGATVLGGTLQAGASTLDSLNVTNNASVGGDLAVAGTTSLNVLTAGVTTLGATTAGSLTVTGSANLAGTLDVANAASFANTVGVLGDLSVNTNKFTVSSATGNTMIAGTLGVSGDLAVNANKFVVAAGSGNTAIAGTLSVAGVTTLAALQTSAAATIGGNMTVNGNILPQVTGTYDLGNTTHQWRDAYITGTLYVSTLSNGNQITSGDLMVTGNTTLGTDTTNSTTINGTISVTGDAAVDGNTEIGGTFTVNGIATLSSDLSVAGASTLGVLSAGATNVASLAVAGNSLVNGSETVNGDLQISGTTTLGVLTAGSTSLSDLTVSGATSLATLTAGSVVADSLTLTNDLAVGGNASVAGTLNVSGATTLDVLTAGAASTATLSVTNNASIGGVLSVIGAINGDSLNIAADATIGNNLNVTGATVLSGTLQAGSSTLDSLDVSVDASVGGNLVVTGTTSLGGLSAGTTTLGATTADSLTVIGNAAVTGTLSVSDAASFANTVGILGDLSVNTDKFTVSGATGNTMIAGILGVAGDLAINTDKFVVSATNGNTTIAGSLNVAGTATLAALQTSAAATIGGNLTVTGNILPQTTATYDLGGSTQLWRDGFFSGELHVATLTGSGNATIGGTLGVTGAATLAGNTTVGGTFTVTGAATLSSSLNVSGATTLGVLSAGATTLSSLGVTGNAAISGNETITGTLGVTGTTTLGVVSASSVSVSGNTTVGGTITSTGDINTSGVYRVNGAQITSGDLSDSSNLAKLNTANTFTASNIIQPSTNTTSAFTVKSTSGGNIFNVDTLASRVGININGATQALMIGNGNFAIGLAQTTPVLTPSVTGGSLATGTYYYRVVPVDQLGNPGIAYVEASTAVTGPTGSVGLAWPAVTGAVSYRVYRGTASLAQDKYFTTTGLTYTDIGATGTNGTVLVASSNAYSTKISQTGNTYFNGGNVGIGTTSPSATLTVQGTAGQTNALLVTNEGGSSLLNVSSTSNSVGTARLIVTSGVTSTAAFLANNNGGGDIAYFQANGATVLNLNATGQAIFKNTTNSSGALQVQNAAGSSALNVDTTNLRVGVANATPGYTLDVAGDINTSGAYRVNGTQISTSNLSDGSTLVRTNTANTFTAAQTVQLNSTAAFNVQNASGTNVLSVNTTDGKLTIQAIADAASMGAELLVTPDFTNAVWTSAGWTTTSTTATNNTNNTTPLSTSQAVPVVGASYQVSYSITGNPAAGSTLTGSFGGVNFLSFTATGGAASVNNPIETRIINATSAAGLNFSPSSSFNGTISGLTIKRITINSNPVLVVNNSSGSPVLALRSSATASNNSFIGINSGSYNVSGTALTAIGAGALTFNTTGTANTSVGALALQLNTNGSNNTATGAGALQYNTSGASNVANGAYALQNNVTGSNNTALGYYTLQANTSGYFNTAVGKSALQNNTYGYQNVAVGSALQANTVGIYNSAIGNNSLQSNLAGIYNAAIGANSLATNINGSNNSGFGSNTDVVYSSQSNSTAIGANARVGSSNTIVLGDNAARSGGTATSTVIGASYANASNILNVGSATYTTGTIAQTGTAITGTGTVWPAFGSGTIYYSDGSSANVTYTSATTLTSVSSKTVAAGATYTLIYGGATISQTATAVFQNTTDSATAFQIKQASGTSSLIVDTLNGGLVGIGTIPLTEGSKLSVATSSVVGLRVNQSGSNDIIQLQSGGVNVFKVGSTGDALFKNQTNSTAAFQVQNTSGTALLGINTTNSLVGIGAAPTVGGATLQVTGSSSFSGAAVFNGTLAVQPVTDAASVFRVQSTAGNSVLSVDTLTGRVGINTASPTQALVLNSGNFAQIASTAINSITPSVSGGTLATGTYYYKVSWVDALGGETAASGAIGEASTSVTGPTGSVSLTWVAIPGAAYYKIYRGTTSVGENTYYTSTANSFTDTGAIGTAGLIGTVAANGYVNKITVNGASYINGGNVGIGVNTTPTSLLSIGKNTTNAAGGILLGTDTTLYRSAAATLTTDGAFMTAGTLSIGTLATATGSQQLCLNGTNQVSTCNAGAGAYVNNGTALQSGANFNIQSASTSSATAVIRALGSQTADLMQFQGSTGNVITAIDASGNLRLGTMNPPTLNTPTVSTTGGSLAAGTYYYTVVALDINGAMSLPSNEVSATTSGSTGSVSLSWSAVTNARRYRVFRGTSAGAENVYYVTSAGATTYTDTNAASNSGTPPTVATASNTVLSTSGVGTSTIGGILRVITPAANQSFSIGTVGNPYGFTVDTSTGYARVGIGVDVADQALTFASGNNINFRLNSPTIATAVPSTTGGSLAANTYYYKVTALDGQGRETAIDSSKESSATTTGSTGSVTVSWTAIPGALGGYRVYRGTSSGGENVYYSVAYGTNTFTDTGATSTSGSGTTALTGASSNFISSNGSSYIGAGNFGIGTAAPTQTLSVSGTALVQGTSATEFQVQNAAGSNVVTVDTANNKLNVTSAIDAATLGSEMITNGDFTTAGWTSTGWTTTSTAATHNTGNTSVLSTNQAAVVTGKTYQVSYSIDGNPVGGSSLIVNFGGQSATLNFGGGSGSGNNPTDVRVFTATSTAGLSFTPSSTFNGIISAVSIVLLTKNASPVLTVTNSSAVTTLEIRSSSTGSTYIGVNAGQNATSSATNNVALGTNALQGTTTGYSNIAIGVNALTANTSGSRSVAIGVGALQSNISGTNNTAIGYNALQMSTAAINNTAVGYSALRLTTTGSYNASFGLQSLQANTTGSNNAAFGNGAISSSTTGNYNTAIGGSALQTLTTGNNNVAIGYNADILYSGLQNSVAIGTNSKVGSNNTVVLGNNNASVVIGSSSYAIGTNVLSVGSGTYTTGTISQTGTVVTGSGTGWTSGMVGGTLYYADGASATINSINTIAQTMVVSVSKTVTAGSGYTLIWGGSNISTTGAYSLQNTADSTAALQIQNAAGVNVFNVDTVNQQLTVRSTNDTATIGNELVTNGDFTSAGWTSTGWATTTTTATHNTGNTTALSTSQVGVVAGNTYQIIFTVSGGVYNASVAPRIGGVTGSALNNSGTFVQNITATSTGALQFVPSSTFTGTVSAVSVKTISASTAAVRVLNSNGIASLEVRTSTAANNSFIGVNAGQSNTTGINNTATGAFALQNNTAGSNNTAFGNNALTNNTIGASNSAFGSNTLANNTSGNNNAAFGNAALINNTTGASNVAIGSSALGSNTVGVSNTAVGNFSLQNNLTGFNNVAVGANALISANSNYNTALGYGALQGTSNAVQNVGIGYNAGVATTSGSNVTAVGSNSLQTNTTGTNISVFGQATDVIYNNLSNSTALGYGATVGTSNTVVLGSGGAGTSIGSSYLNGGLLNVGAQTYTTGTIAQSTINVTGAGTTFTAGMVGGKIYYSDGTSAVITGYTSATQLTVGTSKTVTAGASYAIVWGGLNVSSSAATVLQNTTDSAVAFQVLNAAGSTGVLSVNTANNIVGIGGAPTVGGATLQVTGGASVSGTLTLATLASAASTQLCINGSNQVATCIGGGAYINNSTSLQVGGNFNAQSAATNAVTARIQALSGQTADLLQIQDSASAIKLFAVGATGVATFQNSTNSTNAFQIQNAAGSSNLLIADTVNNRIGIGMTAPAYTLDVNGSINASNAIYINGVQVCTSGGCSGGGGGTAINAINNTTTLQTNANLNIQSAAVGSVTATIRALNGQTADLFQMQTNTGNTIFSASPTGGVVINTPTNTYSALKVLDSNNLSVFSVDTINDRLSVGTLAGNKTSGNGLLTLAAGGVLSTQLASPAAPTLVASTTGGVLGAGTYYYTVVALDGSGAATAVLTTGSANESSVTTTGTTGSVAVSWANIPGAVSYRVYRGTSTGNENTYYAAAANSYTDTGAAGTAGSVTTATMASVIRINPNGNSWINGGNLGIGTATPTSTLQAQGSFSVLSTAGVSVIDTSASNGNVGIGNTATATSRLYVNTGAYVGLRVNQSGANSLLELQNNATNVFSVGATGATTIKNSTDSTSAFSVQTAGSASVLNVDTANQQVTVSHAATSDTITGFVVANSSTAVQSNTASTGTNELYDNPYEAIKFTASTTTTVGSIGLRLKASGAFTGSQQNGMAFKIYTDNGGQPGSVIANTNYKGSIKYGDLATSYAEYQIGAAVPIVSGTAYWIVVAYDAAPIGATVSIDSGTTGASTHAYSSDALTWTTENNKDAWFKLYGQTGVAASFTNSGGSGGGLTASVASGIGINASSTSYVGLIASGGVAGVQGLSANGYGVYGQSTNNYGIYGISTSNTGVRGLSTSGAGGYFSSTSGAGIQGVSSSNNGVFGTSTSGTGGNFQSDSGLGLRVTGTSAGAASIKITGINTTNNSGRLLNLTRDTSGSFDVTGDLLYANDAATNTGTISGNLLNLQKNSSSVFTVGNTGATTVRTTNSSAFNVQNASGNTILNVDTTLNAVAIGSNSSLNITRTANDSTSAITATQTASVIQSNLAATGTDLPLTNTYDAIKFTATATDIAGSIAVRMKASAAMISNSANYYAAYLYTDNSGVPGTALGTNGSLVRFGALTTNYAEYQTGVGPTTINAGTSYWIVLKRFAVPTATVYLDSSGAGAATHATSIDGTTWATTNSNDAWYKVYGNTAAVATFAVANGMGAGLQASSTNGSAVIGTSVQGVGLNGFSTSGKGVYGQSTDGVGVYAFSSTNFGVYSTSTAGVGVQGIGTTGTGVGGSSTSGVGGSFNSATGLGLFAASGTNNVAQFMLNGTSSTAGVVLNLARTTSGTGTATGDLLVVNDAATNTGTISGNLLNLQKNASSVLTVGNTGATIHRNSVDSASAFSVQTAAGTSVLNVDTTTSNVTIGNNGSLTVNRAVNDTVSAINSSVTGQSVQSNTAATGQDELLDNSYEAIKFTSTYTGIVGNIGLRFKQSGGLTNLGAGMRYSIYTDSAGAPGSQLGSTGGFSYGQLTTSYAELQSFSQANITTGVTYWIVISRTTPPIGGTISIDSTATGTATHAYSADGSTWTTESSKDGYFKLYGTTGSAINVSSNNTSAGGLNVSTNASNAVSGSAINAIGVRGTSVGSVGVSGTSTYNTGIQGVSTYGNAGVFTGTYATALLATATNSSAFYAQGRDAGVGQFLMTGANTVNTGSSVLNVTRSTSGTFSVTGDLLYVNDNATNTGTISGNLLNLQKNTTSVFAVGNTGAVTAKNTTDSTNAFTVQNSTGVSMLNINTLNGTIGIGATASPTSLLTIGTATVGATNGISFGGDTNLYRAGASTLGTTFLNVQTLNANRSTTAANALRISLNSDANDRLAINAGGQLSFGDGTSATDTTLYRSTTGTLKTDGDLVAAGSISTAGSSNLVRLNGSGSLQVIRSVASSTAFFSRVYGDTAERYAVSADGTTSFGNGTAAADTILSRSGAGTMQVQAAGSSATTFVVKGTTNQATTDLFQAKDSTGTNLASIDYQGNLTVKAATINGNLTVNGHIITGNTSGSTTAAPGTTAGTGATVSITGNDSAGTITITAGSGAAAGDLAAITFAQIYGANPRIVITADNANAAAMQYFRTATTTGFTINTRIGPVNGQQYIFDYIIHQ